MKTKKLILLTLGLLFFTSQGFATQYCETELKSTANDYPILLTCKNVSGNNYQIILASSSSVTIAGLNLANVEVTKDGNLGSISFTYSNNQVVSSFTSTTTPTKTSGANSIYLNISGVGEKQYQLPSDIDFSATCSSAPVAVTSVSLNTTATALSVGGNETLTATVLPADATNKNIIWSSSNSGIASVVDGVVTGEAVGSATITATSEADGSKFATCTVTVTAAPAPSTACSGTSTEASQGSFTTGYNYKFSTEGTTVNIEFELLDDKTGVVAYLWKRTPTFQEIGMSVSDKKATISLTNQTIGQSITFACKFAYSNGMAVTKDFTYTVGDNCAPVSIESVSLDKHQQEMDNGGKIVLYATVLPVDAANKNINWTSSVPAVATVNTNGVVTGLTNGTTIITATSQADNTKSDQCTVTVVDKKTRDYWGEFTFEEGGRDITVTYRISRKTDGKLEFYMYVDQDIAALVPNINVQITAGGSTQEQVQLSYNSSSRIGTGTSTSTYEDASNYNIQFHLAYHDSGLHTEDVPYVVGSSSISPCGTCFKVTF